MWPVVPICEKQLRDVNPADLLNDGLYRRCNTYKGGGGYDQFPIIYSRRFGQHSQLNDQFVVQLQGCYFDCPYCYVTRDGVNGEAVKVSTEKLVEDFIASGCQVFHLMGGAPDIYYDKWLEIMQTLPSGTVFHSDLMLGGPKYDPDVLKSWIGHTYLHAVSIKGCNPHQYKRNTGVEPDWYEMLSNLWALFYNGVNFYITYTGLTPEQIKVFQHKCLDFGLPELIFTDSFNISIRHYAALEE